jgi:hypothetical protein
MVASAIGQAEDARIVNIPLSEDTESAYAIYNGDKLSKLVAINMRAHNATTTGSRPGRVYQFKVPGHGRAKVERLIAPGSDSLEEVTFAGISYDYSRKGGKPDRVGNQEQSVEFGSGILRVEVPDSSAVLISL